MRPHLTKVVGTPELLLLDPIGWFFAEHQRHRQFCDMMQRASLAASFDEDGLGWLLDFVRRDLPLHILDEEEDLFPSSENPDPSLRMTWTRPRCLLGDHEKDLTRAAAVRHHLEACLRLAAPIGRSNVRRRALEAFAIEERSHLALENAVVLPLARLRLTERTSRPCPVGWQRGGALRAFRPRRRFHPRRRNHDRAAPRGCACRRRRSPHGWRQLCAASATTLVARMLELARSYCPQVAVAVRDASQVAGAVDAPLICDDPTIRRPARGPSLCAPLCARTRSFERADAALRCARRPQRPSRSAGRSLDQQGGCRRGAERRSPPPDLRPVERVHPRHTSGLSRLWPTLPERPRLSRWHGCRDGECEGSDPFANANTQDDLTALQPRPAKTGIGPAQSMAAIPGGALRLD